MRKLLLLLAWSLSFFPIEAQQKDHSFFHPDSLKKDVAFLASDAMKGRANFSKGLEMAGNYIASNFSHLGLKDLDGLSSYTHTFFMTQPSDNETWEEVFVNGKRLKTADYFFTTSYEDCPTLKLTDFVVHQLAPASAQQLKDSIAASIVRDDDPQLFIVPAKSRPMLAVLKKIKFDLPEHSLLVLASDDSTVQLKLQLKQKFLDSKLRNIIGVLPGKTRPNEIVLISAHYDHIGIDVPNKSSKDFIYNGANDDASGVAAMMALANYFANRNDNDRTIVFAAFAGEELGLYGSAYFTSRIQPDDMIVNFNLEMLGKVHGVGKQKLMMTGADYGSLHSIMKKYCDSITILPDNYTSENMFRRSDNFSFAAYGVPAHTFMCFTKNDKNYHQVTDEIKTLDFTNMSNLVKGLLPGIEAVVQGKETPQRLNPQSFK